jgi:hypothetical protein
MLQGAGTLQGAQACHITLGDLQLYAEMSGSSQFEAPAELMIVTAQQPVTSDNELQALKNVLNTGSIDELLSKLTAHKLEANLADLVSLEPLTTPNTVGTHWTTPLLLATSVIVIVAVVYYCTCAHGRMLLKCCIKKSHDPVPDSIQTDLAPSSNTPSKALSTESPSSREAPTDFAVYAVQNLK